MVMKSLVWDNPDTQVHIAGGRVVCLNANGFPFAIFGTDQCGVDIPRLIKAQTEKRAQLEQEPKQDEYPKHYYPLSDILEDVDQYGIRRYTAKFQWQNSETHELTEPKYQAL